MKSFKDHLSEYSGRGLIPVGDNLLGGEGPSRIRKAMSASPEKDPRRQPAGQGKFTQRELDWANATTKNNIKRRIGTHPTPNLPESEVDEQVRAYAVNAQGKESRPSNPSERSKLAKTVSQARATKRSLNKDFGDNIYPTSGAASGNASGVIAGGRERAAVKKIQEDEVTEDWGTSDTSAAMRIMWDTINSEFGGKLSIESMTTAAERAAETYKDSIGLDFKDAADAFLGYFMRRKDGVAAERLQKHHSINESHGTSFQIKIGGSWENVVLESPDLESIAEKFYDGGDLVNASNDVATIHGMVKTYYLGGEDSSIDEDYEVQSVDADELKVAFWFTSDNDRMKTIKGTLAIYRHIEDASDENLEEDTPTAEVFFKLTTPRAKTIMQDMRDVGGLPTINFNGDVVSASAEDVAALRSKLIQSGQIDAFEAVVDESTPVPASHDEVDETAKRKERSAPPDGEYDSRMAPREYDNSEASAWAIGASHGYQDGYTAGYAACRSSTQELRTNAGTPDTRDPDMDAFYKDTQGR